MGYLGIGYAEILYALCRDRIYGDMICRDQICGKRIIRDMIYSDTWLRLSNKSEFARPEPGIVFLGKIWVGLIFAVSLLWKNNYKICAVFSRLNKIHEVIM